jgi:hypothetical protein
MVRRKSKLAFVSLCALTLLLSPISGHAATEDQADGQSSQTESDSKSYLPPWMQKSEGTDTKNIGASEKSETPAVASAESSQPKGQVQKPQRRYRTNDSFLRGFVGLFGR